MIEIAVGDKVRLGNKSIWAGMEGIVTEVDTDMSFYLKVTKDAGHGFSVGNKVHPMKSSVCEVVEKAFPRVARKCEIEVGDTVRVTYPDQVTKENGVTETVTRVREGVVGELRDNCLTAKDSAYIIDAFYDGRKGAVYEILSRPKNWVEEAKIGDKFMLTDEGGITILHKDRPCDWTVHFGSETYSRSSVSISMMHGCADAVKL